MAARLTDITHQCARCAANCAGSPGLFCDSCKQLKELDKLVSAYETRARAPQTTKLDEAQKKFDEAAKADGDLLFGLGLGFGLGLATAAAVVALFRS